MPGEAFREALLRLTETGRVRLHGERVASAGFRVARICSMVALSCEMPSSAKNSHCTGTSTACAATIAFRVSRLSEGGQSMSR